LVRRRAGWCRRSRRTRVCVSTRKSRKSDAGRNRDGGLAVPSKVCPFSCLRTDVGSSLSGGMPPRFRHHQRHHSCSDRWVRDEEGWWRVNPCPTARRRAPRRHRRRQPIIAIHVMDGLAASMLRHIELLLDDDQGPLPHMMSSTLPKSRKSHGEVGARGRCRDVVSGGSAHEAYASRGC
jgi:hypothetical protein